MVEQRAEAQSQQHVASSGVEQVVLQHSVPGQPAECTSDVFDTATCMRKVDENFETMATAV